jgi:hypothetical protein
MGRIYSIIYFRGQQFLDQEVAGCKTTLDIRNLPAGLYLVKLTGEKGVLVEGFLSNNIYFASSLFHNFATFLVTYQFLYI